MLHVNCTWTYMWVKICYKHARLEELHVLQAYHDIVGSNDESLCAFFKHG